jgi:mono/diheme cytochrome c family protein
MRNRDAGGLVLALVGLLGTAGGRPATAADLPGPLADVLATHCAGCHDADSKKGGLDLTALKPDVDDPTAFAGWVKVHDRVKAGEMPPKKALPARDRDGLLKGLSDALTAADRQRYRVQGRVPLRRLNRTEYENTLRDLFSLPGLQVRDILPEDGRFDGFDKASGALDVSAVHLRKYLEAADAVLDAAIAHQHRPMVFKKRFRRVGGLSSFGEASFPIRGGRADLDLVRRMRTPGPDGRTMRLPERARLLEEETDSLGILTHARPAFRPQVETFSPFHPGFYRIRTSVWSFDYHFKNEGKLLPAPRTQSFALTAGGRLLAYLDAPSLAPKGHDLTVWLNAGETLELNPANLWANYNNPLGYAGPAVAVDFVEVEGPLHDAWPPVSHRRLFGDLPVAKLPVVRKGPLPDSYPRQPTPPSRPPGFRPNHVDGDEFIRWRPVWTVAAPATTREVERLIGDFLPRAFRRSVPPEEVAGYARIARERLAAGECFETAMRTAYRTALCSPDFLFLHEPLGTGSTTDPAALGPYALVSRLSYFLWNSMPDDELLALAAKGPLGQTVLGEQIDRMLADPRSDRFVTDFLDQWLKLREIDATSPDRTLYPEFRPDLRDAMLAETRAFFREMLAGDLGVAAVIDSDFLTVNQRLAEHYGIPGVDGSAIRRVPKPKDSPRGGLLTQAAVLKVTANGTATSPVLRGAWVADRILGRPPQPPPPDVPAVDPDVRGTTTIREQLDKHRNSAACASCHAKLDPPGFALESFDVIGGWRAKYRFVGEKVDNPAQRKGDDPVEDRFLGVGVKQWEYVLNNVRSGRAVDATGTTPDGKPFADINEYRRILLSDTEGLARNLVERLTLYGTGVPVGFADRAAVETILQRSRDRQYGLRTLVREVILSRDLFQKK